MGISVLEYRKRILAKILERLPLNGQEISLTFCNKRQQSSPSPQPTSTAMSAFLPFFLEATLSKMEWLR